MIKSDGPYCIVGDDDGHHYVIPVDKEEEWSCWVEKVADFWDHELWVNAWAEEPELPEWADSIGGCPSLVKFGLNK